MMVASLDAPASVAWSVVWFSLTPTRAIPPGGAVLAWVRMRIDLAPRHPARHTTESTAGLLARGSPPVTAFPGYPSGSVVRARRLQLRGQLRNSELWEPVLPFLHRIPCSLSRERP